MYDNKLNIRFIKHKQFRSKLNAEFQKLKLLCDLKSLKGIFYIKLLRHKIEIAKRLLVLDVLHY